MFIYRDINNQLEEIFGPPSETVVMKTESELRIDVTSTINDTELIRGLRNNTHYYYAAWYFSEIMINTVIINEGDQIMIYVRYARTL